MNIEAALDTYLRADSTLMNYLGGIGAPSTTTGRLYWMQAMEGATLPYVVFTMVSDIDTAAHFNTTNTGQGRAQFDVVGSNRAAKDIEGRIRSLLRYKSGSVGGLTMYCIFPLMRRERFNQDTLRYVFTSEFEVHCEY